MKWQAGNFFFKSYYLETAHNTFITVDAKDMAYKIYGI